MRRRNAVIALLSLPLALRAQAQRDRPARVGLVLTSPAASALPGITGRIIQDELHRLGWTDKELQVLLRTAEGHYERLGPIMDELIAMPVDIIVTSGGGVGEAVKRTSTIPIVMNATGGGRDELKQVAGDPPNLTGTKFDASGISGKRMSFLRALLPTASRIGVAWDERSAESRMSEPLREMARALGFQPIAAPYDLANPAPGLDAAVRRGAQAMLLVPSPGMQIVANVKRMAGWMVSRRIPAIHPNSNGAADGCLMSYGANLHEIYRRTAFFVDRLLRGAKPAELPAEQPITYEFVINLKTAEAMRLRIPPALLLQADRVIR
jgi:ABC-type uncharacterized transport system substrate-binding protein